MTRQLVWDPAPGDVRCAVLEGGDVVELHLIPLCQASPSAQAGARLSGRLVSRLGQAQALIALETGEEALLRPVPSVAEGARLMVDIVRSRVPEPGRWKRALARPAGDDAPAPDRITRLLASVDAVICASSFTKHSLASAGSKAPAHVVGYGVDLELFSARTERPVAKPLTVGFVGALSQRKGARYLLAALASLPKGAAKLIIYTRASVDRDLIRGFEGVDVEIRGGLSDAALASDMKQCDLIALPSIAEGFGLVILEAMACGVPVLCTTSTGGADFIHHRQNGLLIEPGSAEAIRQELDWALTRRDELFQIGQAARVEAEKHTWAEYRRKFFAAYCSALGA